MSRYIDAEALVERLKFKRDTDGIEQNKYAGLECAIAQCKKAPTADVVEVVRCKDCERRYTTDCYLWYGSVGDTDYLIASSDDFYCSYGKRSEV